MGVHSGYTGDEIHILGYRQSSDPGAVGAGMWWENTTTDPPVYGVRNAANTDWNILNQAPLVNADLPTTGVAAGTYKSVTVNTKGVTTAGTTLAGKVSETLFVQTASVTVANTTTETTITSTGVGSLNLPVNFLTAGKVIRFRALGYIGTLGIGQGTIQVKVTLEGGTVMLSTASTVIASLSNNSFEIVGEFICRTTGGSGTVMGQGYAQHQNAGSAGTLTRYQMVNTATVTVDTTDADGLDLDITFKWSVASATNTITITDLIVEALG
jgi:hypothetical protein